MMKILSKDPDLDRTCCASELPGHLIPAPFCYRNVGVTFPEGACGTVVIGDE